MSADIFNGKLRLELKGVKYSLEQRGLIQDGTAQRYVDSEVLRLCAPLVPMDTGELIRSGTRETNIGSGQVIYQTPYARRWYYEPANFQGAPNRGNYWFDRMKNNGGKTAILNGLARLTGGKGENK